MSVIALPHPTAVVRELMAWYAETQRELPWRRGVGLYGIWVSEIMLQQTTVDVVIPYWERFLERFPTVQVLASAAESDVLMLWSGLGYYSRARNLYAAARVIASDRAGRWPTNRDEWRELPGIGPYASGAIASIGLGERVPAVDANARRVLLRLAVTDPLALAALTHRQRDLAVAELAADIVPAEQPGDWNQGLMELGALVCGARQAACGECPLGRRCRAKAGGWVAEVPVPKAPAAAIQVRMAQLLIVWRGHVLLWPPTGVRLAGPVGPASVVRADLRGVHRGLWRLPATVWYAVADDLIWPVGQWCEDLHLSDFWPGVLGTPQLVGQFRHSITRYRLQVDVFKWECPADEEIPAAWLDAHGAYDVRAGGAEGLFFRGSGLQVPISKLAEKALHFQHDTVD